MPSDDLEKIKHHLHVKNGSEISKCVSNEQRVLHKAVVATPDEHHKLILHTSKASSGRSSISAESHRALDKAIAATLDKLALTSAKKPSRPAPNSAESEEAVDKTIAATLDRLALTSDKATSRPASNVAKSQTTATLIHPKSFVPPAVPLYSVALIAPSPALPPANKPMPAPTTSLDPPNTLLHPAEIARRRAVVLSNCRNKKKHRGEPQLGFTPALGLPRLCKTVYLKEQVHVLGKNNCYHNAVENMKHNHSFSIRYVYDFKRPGGKPVLYLWLDHKYPSKFRDESVWDCYWDLDNFLNWYATLPVAGRGDLKQMYDEYVDFAENDPRRHLPGNHRNNPHFKAIMEDIYQDWLKSRRPSHQSGRQATSRVPSTKKHREQLALQRTTPKTQAGVRKEELVSPRKELIPNKEQIDLPTEKLAVTEKLVESLTEESTVGREGLGSLGQEVAPNGKQMDLLTEKLASTEKMAKTLTVELIASKKLVESRTEDLDANKKQVASLKDELVVNKRLLEFLTDELMARKKQMDSLTQELTASRAQEKHLTEQLGAGKLLDLL